VRSASVASGSVTVTGATTIDGEDVTSTIEVEHDALDCASRLSGCVARRPRTRGHPARPGACRPRPEAGGRRRRAEGTTTHPRRPPDGDRGQWTP
jgi:hypothetical protein